MTSDGSFISRRPLLSSPEQRLCGATLLGLSLVCRYYSQRNHLSGNPEGPTDLGSPSLRNRRKSLVYKLGIKSLFRRCTK